MSRILIVDDNKQNQYLLQALLGGNGHKVISAANGSEALEFARSNPPDLIISDILMPVIDGFALCREWHADKTLQSIPFVFYTATYTDRKDEELGLSLGAVRFIIKPQEPVRFMEIIREVIKDFTASPQPTPDCPPIKEDIYLKEYNERLIHKLEQKTLALEKEIAERKRTEMQLLHAQKMEAIGTLAGGIAHDFNNILTGIIGYSEIAKAQLPPNGKISRDLDKAIQAGYRAAALVGQILTFSRQGNDGFKLLDFKPVILESIDLLRASLPTTIELKTNLIENCGLILADPVQMQQVIMNLCTNATQAIGDNTGSVEVSLSELLVTKMDSIRDCPQMVPGRYLHLEISDTGCGMNQLTQSKIFDPFFTTKEKGKGTGLGLAVVHGIIKQHKGKIVINSSPGQGTVFHIYLPVIEKERQKEIEDWNVAIDDLPRGRERILLVDDEPTISELTQRFLSDFGYTVTAFTSSIEALATYRQNPGGFDLLVTDMTMPEMTGIVLTKEIRTINPNLPVILCTGFSASMDEIKAKSHGIQGFIKKPIIKKKLVKAIRNVFDNG